MICTEEDAREKWCPHGRMADVETELPAANQCVGGVAGFQLVTKCIASDCMMWVPTDDGRGSCGLSRG